MRFMHEAMRLTILILLAFLSALEANAEISIELPKDLKLLGSVIYREDEKVGEIASKSIWPYSNGNEFVTAYQAGFADDPGTTKFLSSGNNNGIYWVCRKAEYWNGKGNSGLWYVRRFWVNGPIVTFYSHESCNEKFDKILEYAATVKET